MSDLNHLWRTDFFGECLSKAYQGKGLGFASSGVCRKVPMCPSFLLACSTFGGFSAPFCWLGWRPPSKCFLRKCQLVPVLGMGSAACRCCVTPFWFGVWPFVRCCLSAVVVIVESSSLDRHWHTTGNITTAIFCFFRSQRLFRCIFKGNLGSLPLQCLAPCGSVVHLGRFLFRPCARRSNKTCWESTEVPDTLWHLFTELEQIYDRFKEEDFAVGVGLERMCPPSVWEVQGSIFSIPSHRHSRNKYIIALCDWMMVLVE